LDNSGATIKTFGSTYDAVGRLVTAVNSDSSYSYTYDALDRLSSIDNTGTVGVPAVKFNYTYDAVGNLLTVNDVINGTSAGITGYTYDSLNRVTKLTQGGTGVQSKRVEMTYNAVNQLTLLSRYSGAVNVANTNFVYDTNQRLIQLSHLKGGSSIASYDYSYDVADKLARTVSSVDGTSDFSYDATNQLTGADNTTQPDEAYSYDANGNRTIAGYATGANNQLLSDGTYNYTYDGEGNRTKRTEIATGSVMEYVWDYRNRLTSVVFKDASGVVTKTIEYTYDGDNQRIGQKLNGVVTERYVYDRNQIALVFDGSGTQTHRYLYGTQIDQVLSDETPTSMAWALADRLGTVSDLVDNSGSVVNHITYDSFGQVVSQTDPSVVFRYGYTGREQDNDTGLDYYRARYYDAGVGRFISEDPIGFEAEDTNFYRYVSNNSVNLTDSSGYKVDIVGSPRRTIEYTNRTGRHRVFNIADVNRSRITDRTTTITFDMTFAVLRRSGSGNNNQGTSVNDTARQNIPDILSSYDDAGHIIGKQLGGSGTDPNNLFSQQRFGNNRYQRRSQGGGSRWRAYENEVRNILETRYQEDVTNAPMCGTPPPPRSGYPTGAYTVWLSYPQYTFRPNNIFSTTFYSLGFRASSLPPFSAVNINNL
jgi:RHS repeat-associated protein